MPGSLRINGLRTEWKTELTKKKPTPGVQSLAPALLYAIQPSHQRKDGINAVSYPKGIRISSPPSFRPDPPGCRLGGAVMLDEGEIIDERNPPPVDRLEAYDVPAGPTNGGQFTGTQEFHDTTAGTKRSSP